MWHCTDGGYISVYIFNNLQRLKAKYQSGLWFDFLNINLQIYSLVSGSAVTQW